MATLEDPKNEVTMGLNETRNVFGYRGKQFHTSYHILLFLLLLKISKSKMLTNVVLKYYNISNYITNILKTIVFKQGNIFILRDPPFFKYHISKNIAQKLCCQ